MEDRIGIDTPSIPKTLLFLALCELFLAYGSRILPFVNEITLNNRQLRLFLLDEGKVGISFVIYSLLFIISMILFHDGWRRALRRLFLDSGEEIVNHIAYTIAAGFTGLLANGFLSAAVTVVIRTENANRARVMLGASGNHVLFAIYAVILAPVVEETLYRYGIYGMLCKRSRVLACIASSLLFGLSHVWKYAVFNAAYEQFLFAVPYAAMGFSLTLIYGKTKCAVYPLFFHVAINLVSVLVTLLRLP